MKIDARTMRVLKSAPNSAYDIIKPEFLYHSNKLEGSTFTEKELVRLVDEGVVSGSHTVDDTRETLNSLEVFDYTVDTLGEPIDERLVCEMNRLLMKDTEYDRNGWTGHYKLIPNRLPGTGIEVSLPKDVPVAMEELFETWEAGPHDLEAIARFHSRFEHIHPFQEGNGRIGRFLILKQCVENDVDLVSVDEIFNEPYKAWLEVSQTHGDFRFLIDVFEQCQQRLEIKMQEKGVLRLLPTKAQVDAVLDDK